MAWRDTGVASKPPTSAGYPHPSLASRPKIAALFSHHHGMRFGFDLLGTCEPEFIARQPLFRVVPLNRFQSPNHVLCPEGRPANARDVRGAH
jgi:hypothetical protein